MGKELAVMESDTARLWLTKYPVVFGQIIFIQFCSKRIPRYFRLGQGTVKHRILYALWQQVNCHTDKGGRTFAWENVLAAFTTGGLSNAYYPPAERGLGLTMSRSAISIGYGSLGGLVDEFYPDIAHRLLHRHDKQAAQKNP
jgi:hypothetical protein